MKRLFISMLACGALFGGTAAFAHQSVDYGAWHHQAPWIKGDQIAANQATPVIGNYKNCSALLHSCFKFNRNYNLPATDSDQSNEAQAVG